MRNVCKFSVKGLDRQLNAVQLYSLETKSLLATLLAGASKTLKAFSVRRLLARLGPCGFGKRAEDAKTVLHVTKTKHSGCCPNLPEADNTYSQSRANNLANSTKADDDPNRHLSLIKLAQAVQKIMDRRNSHVMTATGRVNAAIAPRSQTWGPEP